MSLQTKHAVPCTKLQLCVFAAIAFSITGFMYIRLTNHSQTRVLTGLGNTAHGQRTKKLCLLGPKERCSREAQKQSPAGSKGCFLHFPEGKQFHLQETIGINYLRYQ